MRQIHPFQREDLEDLDAHFFAKAARVVAMEDCFDGAREPNVIGLRHDCDHGHSLATAVKMARWEYEHGYRSTYYILHTSPYWDAPEFSELLERIAGLGHEIGIHTNALAESLRTGEDPHLILERALDRLRGLGHTVRGVAGHGDRFCTRGARPGEPWFANDEQFTEIERFKVGDVPVEGHGRMLWRGNIKRRLTPRPLADFGLEYEALHLSLPWYFRLSDSGGKWCDEGFYAIAERFAQQTDVTAFTESIADPRQLHILVHPDWWAEAFEPARSLAA